MNSNHVNMQILRESYYSLEIGREEDHRKEPVWVKKLRNILNNDIHQKSLGCNISNTHVSIGPGMIHTNSFFEAQLLFSHAKWINRFAMWLEKEIEEKAKNPCLIIGYETFIEPVLANLKSRNSNVNYCIYEEPKYTQRDSVSGARLRYLEDVFSERLGKTASKIQSVIFLCGISSTLSTHDKMKQLFLKRTDELNIVSLKKLSDTGTTYTYYNFVQILPDKENRFQKQGSFALTSELKLYWDKDSKTITCNSSKKREFTARYLVDVDTEWQLAAKCEWCFPEDPLQEKPLITTDATSVIPVQRIGFSPRQKPKPEKIPLSLGASVLFKKKSDGTFYCQDYLYYNHVERGEHHFRYYIRTSKLFDYALGQQEFSDFCNSIRKSLSNNFENNVHIILAPHHFSNDRFPHEINRRVFDNMAHVISFDPRSEYRSNFETKYSNYAYVLEQIKRMNQGITTGSPGEAPPKICIYYVDDEIIAGNTFSRTKSFVSSLMRKYADASLSTTNSYKIFSAVITLIDRSSNSSKLNYIDSFENYHSFIHLSIPSLRNYGDACPLCKQIQEAKNVLANSCLNSTAQYWKEKEQHLQIRTLEEARNQIETESPKIRHRHFVRLYCENLLWEHTMSLWTESEIISVYFTTIHKEIVNKRLEDQYEYLISFIKAISRPFLYNKEDGKKAALKLLLILLEKLLDAVPQKDNPLCPDRLIVDCYNHCITKGLLSGRSLKGSQKEKSIPENIYIYERYSLLCIVISCLSVVGSTYLLKSEHIEKLCNHVDLLEPHFNRFNSKADNRDEELGFYTVIVNNFKSLVCGVSGRNKSNWAEEGLWHLLNSTENPERIDLYKVLYLENIQESDESKNLAKRIRCLIKDEKPEVISKYQQLGQILSEAIERRATCTFHVAYGNQLIEMTEKISSVARECVFSEIAEDHLEQIGYFEQEGQFWIVFQPKKSLPNDINCVFLKLDFSVDTKENYRDVRQLLILRAEILRIITADMETGALKAAIQAKAAESILLTDKTQSHGQSNDINRFFKLVFKQFESARRCSTEEMCKAYEAINLFMNRCIAFGATKAAMKKYFLSEISSASTPFVSRIQHLTQGSTVTVPFDIRRYLEIIQKEDSYIKCIKEDLECKHDSGQNKLFDSMSVNIKVTDLEPFEKISYVPYLINADEIRNSSFTLIGIIDVFLRNAIEHSGTPCNITISCSMGEDSIPEQCKTVRGNYSHSYSITITNRLDADSKEMTAGKIGFTMLFMEEYLGLRFPKKESQYFLVNMGKTDVNEFQAQIICIAPEVEE